MTAKQKRNKKYRKLLTKIIDFTDDELIYSLLDQLLKEKSFLTFVKETYDWSTEEHDGLLLLLTPPRNDNGYYTDKYGNKISYNGIRVLKREKTEMNVNLIQEIETNKCTESFKYFRTHYCFIVTKTGLGRPEPRRYQVSLEDELLSLEDLVVLYPRQSGKTVTVGNYLLWRSMFHETAINIGIVANKPSTAREVLDKINKVFLELPIWLMKGITVWNKSSIEFETGTRIMTDSPSSDSFRGYTCNIIYTDEAGYIKHSDWDDFIDAVIPTMNSLIFKQVINTSTANGMNHFKHLVDGAMNKNYDEQMIVAQKDDIITIDAIGEFSVEDIYEQFHTIERHPAIVEVA